MKKIILAIIACTFGCFTANAQDYVEAPYGFVGLRGGAQTILLEKHGKAKVSPTAALSAGAMFNPYLGLRIDFQGIWNKFGVEGGKNYSFKTLNGDLDLLLNVTNFFRANKYSPFNLYVLGGAGVGGNLESLDESSHEEKDFLNDWYNFRAGIIADYSVSKRLSVNFEVDGTRMLGSKSEVFGNGKYKVAAYVGLTYRFPFAKEKETPVYAVQTPVTTTNSYDAEAAARAEAEAKAAAAKAAAAKAAAAKAAAAKAAEEAARNATIDETIYFTIGKTDSADKFEGVVSAAADWCKKTGKVVDIKGYADKGTGTARVNDRVAKARATAVADAIKAKGVPADQINVTSYGAKVQPYAENDQNRCVIVVGK